MPRTPTQPSGEFRVRLPPGLHAVLRKQVQAGKATSLNELCVAYLAEGAGYPLEPNEKRGRTR